MSIISGKTLLDLRGTFQSWRKVCPTKIYTYIIKQIFKIFHFAEAEVFERIKVL